jgi:hypothetical protein
VSPASAPELPVLEVLAAAPDGALEEGRVEAAGLLLFARALLVTGGDLEVSEPNGRPAASPEFIDGIFSGLRRGLVRRTGFSWEITERGRELLREAGTQPSEEARDAVARIRYARMDDLMAEVDASLARVEG